MAAKYLHNKKMDTPMLGYLNLSHMTWIVYNLWSIQIGFQHIEDCDGVVLESYLDHKFQWP